MKEKAKEKAGHGEKKSRKEDLALAALLSCATIGEAAKKAGVSETTLWRWLQDEEFQAKYREAKKQAVGHAVTRLQQATSEAVNTLGAVMKDSEATASAKVAAAKTVLEMAFKAVELEDYAERLRRLEDAVAAGGGRR